MQEIDLFKAIPNDQKIAEELHKKKDLEKNLPGPNEDFDYGKPGLESLPFIPNSSCNYCHGSGIKTKTIGKHKKHIKRVESLCNRCAHEAGMCTKCLGTGYINPGNRRCHCLIDGLAWKDSKKLGNMFRLNYPNGRMTFAGH